MSERRIFSPRGVIPATLLAFHEDLRIDEMATRRHLNAVGKVDGLSAITVNGHSSEVHACSFEDQKKILNIALEEIGDKLPIVNGIYADGGLEAAQLARKAENLGASALLVFPPNSLAMGGYLRWEMAKSHFRSIAEATDLPLILFLYPQSSGIHYPFETLLKLFEEIPSIVAIKDWCNDPLLHEQHVLNFQSLARPISVLTTHSSWLLQSLVTGCNGLLSGAGSVAAAFQVALFNAVQSNDLQRAREINEMYKPLAHAFYAPPFVDMHNRMKEALVMLGELENAYVRPPLMKLSKMEIQNIKNALVASGLLEKGALKRSA